MSLEICLVFAILAIIILFIISVILFLTLLLLAAYIGNIQDFDKNDDG